MSETLEIEYVYKIKDFFIVSATFCISLSHDPEPILFVCQMLTSLKQDGNENYTVISFVYISLGKLCMKF
jgi:hypothetical protein